MRKSTVLACALGVMLLQLAHEGAAGPVAVFPPPIPSPNYGTFRVTHTETEISLGQSVTANWSAAPPGGSDWVGLYEAGASDTQYAGYCYTGGTATGSCALTPLRPGTWELRYYLGTPAYTLVAVSERFDVIDRCAQISYGLRYTGPAVGAGGRRLDVSWTVEPAECVRGNDWIAVYATGSANTAYLGYFYAGTGSGTQSVYVPVPTGSYEFRYLPRGVYEDTARTEPFAVTCAVGDSDCDGRADALDRCPYFAEATPTADADADGRGDACECTDQNGDGRNTVADLVAINQAVYSPSLATPLCDGNNDGRCDVSDIVAAQREIFSPGQTATCSRQPF